ncbi:MAG: DUF5723 family protein [Melioribacteraceae bacterium]|nr:DUF5723 family protein [Melioribacteraceae bacterium]
MKKIFLISIALLSSTLIAQGIGSQGSTDARSMSMGKSFASSFGLMSIGKNPANLYQDTSSVTEFILPLPVPNVSLSVGSNFITIDDYNYYFGTKVIGDDGKNYGRELTETDKKNLKEIFKDGGSVYSDISFQLIGVKIQPSKSFGAIGFSITDRFSSTLTLPKSLIDLGLDGNLPNQVYNFSDTKFKAWWLRKTSFTYSRNFDLLKGISVGASVNLVSGYFYIGVEKINTELKTGDANIITGKGDFLAYSSFSKDFNVKYNFDNKPKKDFSFTAFPDPSGKGVGFDFGLSAKLTEKFSIAFSITDIGSIEWNKDVAQFSSNAPIYLDDITDKDQIDTLTTRLTGKNNGKYINSIKTDMATALHFAVVYSNRENNIRSSGRMLAVLEFHYGFNEQPGNYKSPRVVTGLDYSLTKVVGLRSGFSIGGFDKFSWALGLGFDLGLLEINIGSPDFQNVISPNSAKRVTLAFDSRWRF